jgi:hypothetical protein
MEKSRALRVTISATTLDDTLGVFLNGVVAAIFPRRSAGSTLGRKTLLLLPRSHSNRHFWDMLLAGHEPEIFVLLAHRYKLKHHRLRRN